MKNVQSSLKTCAAMNRKDHVSGYGHMIFDYSVKLVPSIPSALTSVL